VNLDFLALDAEGAVARSPMERNAKAAGARFEVRDGWNVAVAYETVADREIAAAIETAGWADTSHLRKLELQASPEELDATGNLRLGEAVRAADAWWCRLTPTRAVVVGGTEPVADAVDVTTNFAAITIVGPLAREVFARFCALDLRPAVTPVGALRPGSIARQPGIVICEEVDRYLFLFGWATGEYMWSVVADAGTHLGGRPIGAAALATLSQPEPARA
jgi:glycine cleavage system aminomethyltransferase T